MKSLAEIERGCTDAEAAAFFDALPTVPAADVLGRYRGSEIPSGHPWGGLLARYGWYGKDFVSLEEVHPLLFEAPSGEVFAVDPQKVPLALAPIAPRKIGGLGKRIVALGRVAIATTEPRARLRNLEHRGKVSAAMIYDHLPIQDAFRRIDADTLMGTMDRRGDDRPFWFVLRRARGS